jgi:hypothetical protein
MNREDVICVHKKVELTAEKQKAILLMINRHRLDTQFENDTSKIIRKTDLKNHDVLVIEHKFYYDGRPRQVAVGIADVSVNMDKNTLTGFRVLRCNGIYMFEERTYYLDNYRKNWRAWTRVPNHQQAWK